MGHQAIILMMITALAGSFLIYAETNEASDADVIWAAFDAKSQARYAAMKGLGQTLEKLDASEFWANESDYHLNLNYLNGGYYWTRVVLQEPDVADIVATGMMKYNTENGMPADTVHIIQVRYKRNRVTGDSNANSLLDNVSVIAYSEW